MVVSRWQAIKNYWWFRKNQFLWHWDRILHP